MRYLHLAQKAVGVKSVNLKDDDYIVNYVLADPKYIDLIKVGIITQRGAFKQLKLNLINKVTRAKRGVLVLRELKTKPHRIMAISSYGENHIAPSRILLVIVILS